MSKNLILDGIQVGGDSSPYIIAEMSANHSGKIENALKIIKKAKECGASAVKIQTYKPDTITINHNSEEFIIQKGIWKGWKPVFIKRHTHHGCKKLFEYSRELGITLFSSH